MLSTTHKALSKEKIKATPFIEWELQMIINI